MSGEKDYKSLEADGDGLEPFHIEICGDELTMSQTYEQNGDLMYDPRIDFVIDRENEKLIPIRYENSGLGKYEEFELTPSTTEMSKRINSLLEFSDNLLDSIEENNFMEVERTEPEMQEEEEEISDSRSGYYSL